MTIAQFCCLANTQVFYFHYFAIRFATGSRCASRPSPTCTRRSPGTGGGASSIPTPSCRGSIPTPTSRGSIPTPTSWGSIPTPTSRGSIPTPTSRGSIPTLTSRGYCIRGLSEICQKKFVIFLCTPYAERKHIAMERFNWNFRMLWHFFSNWIVYYFSYIFFQKNNQIGLPESLT